jgi:hypothetical protein
MGLLREYIEDGECGRQHDHCVGLGSGDAWTRSALAAEQTRVMVERMQTSVKECQTSVGCSRAQVTTSRALLDRWPAAS